MRVMWFVNNAMPAVHRRAGRQSVGSGFWMSSLLDELSHVPDIQLDVVSALPGTMDDQWEDGGVRYHLIGQPRRHSLFRCRNRDLEAAVAIVRERLPDVVHIHGTERFYGLLPARKLISTPSIISIQGLLEPYLPAFYGGLSQSEIRQSHRLIEIAARRGLAWLYREYVHGAQREREIMEGVQSFMGRTEWDRAHVQRVNPAATYFRGDEMLRPIFRQTRWSLDECERHSVVFTNAGEPRRGTETLLSAMQIVRREYPDAKIRLAGSVGNRRGYERFLRARIAALGLADAVEFLGYIEGDAMADALRRSHVFAISSFIENSPNSLCEAMQSGLPCVATFVGGIPSLVDHGRTGLLYPAGDAALLAASILRMFRDDDLATRLGRAARAEATERHAPERILSQVMNAYRAIGSGHQKTYATASHAVL
jgi:glycosyltransferase involved in cell wall biosynthesis